MTNNYSKKSLYRTKVHIITYFIHLYLFNLHIFIDPLFIPFSLYFCFYFRFPSFHPEQLLRDLGQRVEMRDVDESSVSNEESEEIKRERFRVEVVNEILISERYYVRDLEIVVKLFLTPLRSLSIISTGELDTLFSNIELILKVNKEILGTMIQDFMDAGNIQLMNVGRVFLNMVCTGSNTIIESINIIRR